GAAQCQRDCLAQAGAAAGHDGDVPDERERHSQDLQRLSQPHPRPPPRGGEGEKTFFAPPLRLGEGAGGGVLQSRKRREAWSSSPAPGTGRTATLTVRLPWAARAVTSRSEGGAALPGAKVTTPTRVASTGCGSLRPG